MNMLLPYVGNLGKICLFILPDFMFSNKSTVLMKAFIESQFGCCPLIWIFHSRFSYIFHRFFIAFNNKIKYLHERSLGIVYKDNISSCEHLLKRDKSFTIHKRNIQSLAKALFKVE